MSTTGTQKRIPFLDLSRQHKEIERELNAAVGDVISRGNFVLGSHVSAFELEWADYCSTSFCAGVANGTDAIALALIASGAVQPGRLDEVIVPAITAGYTALAVLQAGAVPVFADVDPETLLIEPSSVEQVLTDRTKAIVPVHLYGQVCDLSPLTDIVSRHGLALIEDAAQAHGAWRGGGSVPRTAAFSFYPTKNLGACGDAGAVVSDDPGLTERVKLLRQGGHPEAMSQTLTGGNTRLDEMQAAILRVKLKRLDSWNQRRERFAGLLDEALGSGRVMPVLRDLRNRQANHLYVVRCESRDDLRGHLQQRGIETAVHYPTPLHRLPLFARAHVQILPNAEAATSEIVSLPMNSHTEDWEVEAVAEAIRELS